MARTYVSDILDEGTTYTFSATMVDANGTVIGAPQLTSLTLTLYDTATRSIINLWDRINILNANGVTMSLTGVLTWVMAEEDMVIVDDTAAVEEHVILIEARWSTAGIPRVAYDETVFRVRNLALVPEEEEV